MFVLPDRAERNSYGETSFEDTNFTAPDGRKISVKSIISQANTISLLKVFEEEGIFVHEEHTKIVRCPFHKGGNERKPSLWWYPETNSFYCWSCKVGGRPTDFVVHSRKIKHVAAALYLIEKYPDFLNQRDVDTGIEPSIYFDKSVVEFAGHISHFIKSNHYDSAAIVFAEQISYTFDKMFEKYTMSHKTLLRLIEKLKARLEQYK